MTCSSLTKISDNSKSFGKRDAISMSPFSELTVDFWKTDEKYELKISPLSRGVLPVTPLYAMEGFKSLRW